jgi:hypothetical protein
MLRPANFHGDWLPIRRRSIDARGMVRSRQAMLPGTACCAPTKETPAGGCAGWAASRQGFAPGEACLARSAESLHAQAAPRRASVFANGTILQHVPASRNGKQRRQAAALHRRVAAERLARNGRHLAEDLRRAQHAVPLPKNGDGAADGPHRAKDLRGRRMGGGGDGGYSMVREFLPLAMAEARRAPRSSLTKPKRQRMNCTFCRSSGPPS